MNLYRPKLWNMWQLLPLVSNCIFIKMLRGMIILFLPILLPVKSLRSKEPVVHLYV